MKDVISSTQIPIKMWLGVTEIESGALDQAKNLANLPFAFKHIAIMPDAHQGFGMPIGGVMATKGVVVPNAVGVDIGCGMCAVKTSLTELDKDTLKKIMGEIRQQIPVGCNKHEEVQPMSLMPVLEGKMTGTSIVSSEWSNAMKSLGTLGGGNHFIEIQKGDDGYIWIMIHSGSRNLGYKVANHYNKLAVELNENWHTQIPKKQGLAFLLLDSDEGRAYIDEMNYCVEFAFANRKLMIDRVLQGMEHVLAKDGILFEYDEMINIAHNYAAMENHFGHNVMVHRKGATRARLDEIGIIPGSMGTKSYIVKGKGNKDSFQSCSHGAGRTMSRSKAKETLNLDDEIAALDALGVIHGLRNVGDLDEAPSSYKDIAVVMDNQKDLVDIAVELSPLGVVKG